MTARPPRLLPQGSMFQIVVALGFSIAFAITVAWCPPTARGERRIAFSPWPLAFCMVYRNDFTAHG